MYSLEELTEIKSILNSNQPGQSINPDLKNKINDDHTLASIDHLWKCATSNHNQMNYINKESMLNLFNPKFFFYLAFSPESHDMFYNSNPGKTEVKAIIGNRGLGAIIKNETKHIVIKPVQANFYDTKLDSVDEIEIAKFAEKIGLGPKQYESLKGYITEEFLDGDLFPRLSSEKLTDENMYSFGQTLGNGLKLLHNHNFYYNDTILSDDMGHSNCMITSKGLKLFDYGTSMNLTKHPDYNDEQIFNYAKTLILAPFRALPENHTKEMQDKYIAEHRHELQLKSKDELFDQDYDFVIRGIMVASMRFDKNISTPFLRGFHDKYD